jgi:hypothetical protein
VVTVLVAINQSLLGDALVDLLAQDEALQLYRLAATQPHALLQALDEPHIEPQVIIVDELLFTNELYDRAGQMGKNGRLQLLILSAEHNQIHVYQSFRLTITSAHDLTNLITTFHKAERKSHRSSPVTLGGHPL